MKEGGAARAPSGNHGPAGALHPHLSLRRRGGHTMLQWLDDHPAAARQGSSRRPSGEVTLTGFPCTTRGVLVCTLSNCYAASVISLSLLSLTATRRTPSTGNCSPELAGHKTERKTKSEELSETGLVMAPGRSLRTLLLSACFPLLVLGLPDLP